MSNGYNKGIDEACIDSCKYISIIFVLDLPGSEKCI